MTTAAAIELPALLAAYYADPNTEPVRLLVIADAFEDAGRADDAAWVRQAYDRREVLTANNAALFDLGRDAYSRQQLMCGVRNRFPVHRRRIARYGCVRCQQVHDEDDGLLFWQHRHDADKHGVDYIDADGWVWTNAPYWTRAPHGQHPFD